MNTLFPGTIRSHLQRKYIISLVLLCLNIHLFSQEISINCSNEPLNQILISLRDNYRLMLSFDDQQLSTFKLTIDKKFASPNQAFDYLLRGLPLKYEVSDGVYIFYTVQIKVKPKKYILAGIISDRTNNETLPFSGIMINNTGLISDAKGNFAYTSTTDSIFTVKISYLGYYILDTVVARGTNYSFKLTPSVIALQEIIVEGLSVERTIQMGSSPGISKLNHKIAYYLPGNGDNSVFNLLRLQPGILASGEQSADLIIWGSYEGQSQVIFDGFTIYGMKNFNDNISAVNPYMAKDIKVLKGGYGAEYGEKVGGIVDITGSEGNRLYPSTQFSINNMTLNGKFSVPFSKKSALVLAYRQTYYTLYDPIEFSTSGYGRGQKSSGVDYYTTPDYGFRDANLKYSGSGNRSNYYISLYGGKDNFSYVFDQESQHKTIALDYSEENLQLGASAFYGLTWKEKNTSNLTVSFSSLQTDRSQEEQIVRTSGNQVTTDINNQYCGDMNEVNGRVDNKFTLTEKQILDAGFGLLYYFTDKQESVASINALDEEVSLPVPYLYIQDNITLFKKLTLKPGIRTDFHWITNRIYLQPRFSVMYRINDYFKVNSAAGMYNQFVAKNMTIDTSGNYQLAWSICDDDEVSVLNSRSYSLGFSFNKNDYTVNIEGYLRSTGGITRYLETADETMRYEGDGKTKGLDFFIKKEFKNQTVWISYTLSKTEEYFSYFPTDEYLPAMHDQRHELKLTGLAKIKSFHFSANFVYGSGFPDPDQLPGTVDYLQPYSRLDASIIYKFSKRKFHVDAGVSVLNVLNKENIRYSNYTRIPTDEITTIRIYADAVPLTPALFLNLYF
jgi:hypothetical protein